ncbi:hypothetical protein ADK87_25710 [Streptomyces sp. NRRL F-4711]|nr:hypothetical protein ADK87_25710 [Streptomyces sp. NRRL F-4711]
MSATRGWRVPSGVLHVRTAPVVPSRTTWAPSASRPRRTRWAAAGGSGWSGWSSQYSASVGRGRSSPSRRKGWASSGRPVSRRKRRVGSWVRVAGKSMSSKRVTR